MKKIFLFVSICEDRTVAKIYTSVIRHSVQDSRLSSSHSLLPAVAMSAAFIRVMNIYYGCRETTTRPDRELVIPLQYTVVELA